jgi:hypothetical protein
VSGIPDASDLGETGQGFTSDDLARAALGIARRCAAGGTIWCCSERWPSHAHHVAVEFVHPVVIGKRALPAVVVEGPDLVYKLRTSSRSGDVIVVISTAEEIEVLEVMRRAPAWGAMTVWLVVGDRPSYGAADHVLWFGDDYLQAAQGGEFVLTYHLLWELSQVCFEYPGLTASQEAPSGHETCVTCSDEGRLAEVIAYDGRGAARVRTARGIESVETTLVGDVSVDDLVLVHAGTAVSVLGEGPR